MKKVTDFELIVVGVSGEFFARLVDSADEVHKPELNHQELSQPPLQGKGEGERQC